MILEGVITNVTNFGAFVDIGVHQDGLVHISSLTDKFVADPSEVVKAGDIVKVKVLEVDVNRKRISLTMRLEEQPKPANANKKAPTENRTQQKKAPAQKQNKQNNGAFGGMVNSAFADAFANAKKK